jgi:filamentous hemagglutinin
MFSREDYGQQRTHMQLGKGADGRSVPHEHGVLWSEKGPIGKQYRELNGSGKPVGDWIKE